MIKTKQKQPEDSLDGLEELVVIQAVVEVLCGRRSDDQGRQDDGALHDVCWGPPDSNLQSGDHHLPSGRLLPGAQPNARYCDLLARLVTGEPPHHK